MKMPRYTLFTAVAFALVMASCTSDPNSPGIEYMPDMYRSPAVEAYVDYGEDPYYVTEEYASASQRNTMSARVPAPGTIANVGTKETDIKLLLYHTHTLIHQKDMRAAGAELKSPLASI